MAKFRYADPKPSQRRALAMNLVELFCHVDDFCQAFEADWIRHQLTTGRLPFIDSMRDRKVR